MVKVLLPALAVLLPQTLIRPLVPPEHAPGGSGRLGTPRGRGQAAGRPALLRALEQANSEVADSLFSPRLFRPVLSLALDCSLGVLDEANGHPSPLGTYLIACTFVASMLRLSPVGLAWAPDGVSDAQRDQMQMFAQRASAGE